MAGSPILTMFAKLKAWRRRRVLHRFPIDEALWVNAIRQLHLLQGMPAKDLERLREWVTLFVHAKTFYGVQGLEVDDWMRIVVAAQACLPILNLDVDFYRGWSSIILYPGGFVARHQVRDEAGVVHESARPLIGEAWDEGPLVLSWDDARPGRHPFGTGTNVVVHEFAHKLDMLNGVTNGLPPLPRQMRVDRWAAVFTHAFEDHRRRIQRGEELWIDPYAAESPGEFFAVVSECFFEAPWTLLSAYPEVFEQLARFYRQDPSRRFPQPSLVDYA